MEQSENIGDLALALSKAQGMLEGAAKSSDNPFFKSKYADLHECIEAAKSALSKNDLAVIQTTDTDENGNIWIHTMLAHKSGQWVRGRLRMKPKKDDDQATGSSITYGRRYCFAAIVGLAQKDDDANESTKEPEQKHTEKKQTKPKTEPKSTDRTIIDGWLKWLDGAMSPGVTKAVFASEWAKNKLDDVCNSLHPDFQKELMDKEAEVLKYLEGK